MGSVATPSPNHPRNESFRPEIEVIFSSSFARGAALVVATVQPQSRVTIGETERRRGGAAGAPPGEQRQRACGLHGPSEEQALSLRDEWREPTGQIFGESCEGDGKCGWRERDRMKRMNEDSGRFAPGAKTI